MTDNLSAILSVKLNTRNPIQYKGPLSRHHACKALFATFGIRSNFKIRDVDKHPTYPPQSITLVPDLDYLDVLGLQLPEILASTASGEGVWEF